ncbi:hypothetical protein D9M71_765720 [compost metagenome]
MAHLLRQAAHRNHDPTGQQTTKAPGADHAEQKTGQHHVEHRLFASLELMLVFNQHILVTAMALFVDVKGFLTVDYLRETVGKTSKTQWYFMVTGA